MSMEGHCCVGKSLLGTATSNALSSKTSLSIPLFTLGACLICLPSSVIYLAGTIKQLILHICSTLGPPHDEVHGLLQFIMHDERA